MPKIDIRTQKSFIRKFEEERPKYVVYAEVLQKIFEKARDLWAPQGFVTSRPKSVTSFSEKIIRKDKYLDPLKDMTDLCGARVITHFSSQVKIICRFIEENFEIDLANSLDQKSRLKSSEFGYRSVHYIVTPVKPEILGVKIPREIRFLKAEVQVRTFHEHIWADIGHDRIYKSPIKISEEWKRDTARLAALLEEADNAFAEMSETIDQFSIGYQPTPEPATAKNEAEILSVLIELDEKITEKNIENRLKLSRLHSYNDEWERSAGLFIPVLPELENFRVITQSNVLREYGYTMCKLARQTGDQVKLAEGLEMIKKAVALIEDDQTCNHELSLALFYLGKLLPDEASSWYNRACMISPENPYYFSSLLVEDIARGCGPGKDDYGLIASKLSGIDRECNEHIALGIEVVKAMLTIVRIRFIRKEYMGCLDMLTTLMDTVVNNRVVFQKDDLIDEYGIYEKLSGFDLFHSRVFTALLSLICFRGFGQRTSGDYLKTLVSGKIAGDTQVIIFTGDTDVLTDNENLALRTYVLEALRDFQGTALCVGTHSGIPRLVGSVSSEKEDNKTKKFRLIGYLPGNLSVPIKRHPGYDDFSETEADRFSVLEIVSYWSDILMSGKKPGEVMLFGFRGNEMTLAECRIALAMGASVCVVDRLGGASDRIIADAAWNSFPNLMVIPDDPLTIWALVNKKRPGILTPEEVDQLARIVHERYRIKRLKGLKPEETDINKFRVVMEWDKLASYLQESNRHQVQFMEHIFNRCGLRVRKSEHPQLFVIDNNFRMNDEKRSIRMLGRLEHARWNAERLLDGWRYAPPPRDILKKQSPYIISWDQLDEEIKTYDYDPVKEFPELLMQIGYEVVEI